MYTGLPKKDKTLVFCLTLNDTNTNVVYKIRDGLQVCLYRNQVRKKKYFVQLFVKYHAL